MSGEVFLHENFLVLCIYSELLYQASNIPGSSVLVFLVQRKYRTKAETVPFTPVADRVDYVTAKNSTEILSDVSLLSVSGLHLTSVILYLMCFV